MYKYIRGGGGGRTTVMGDIKEKTLFPLVWGMRFSPLAAAKAPAAGGAGAAAGRRQGGRRGGPRRSTALARRSPGKGRLFQTHHPLQREGSSELWGREMETSRFKFLHCIS